MVLFHEPELLFCSLTQLYSCSPVLTSGQMAPGNGNFYGHLTLASGNLDQRDTNLRVLAMGV